MATAVATATRVGKVVQVIGPVLDVEFRDGYLPAIYNALRVTGLAGQQPIDIVVEVEQHLGENRVRAVAMKPTDGLQRGMIATDLGGPISMPVGPMAVTAAFSGVIVGGLGREQATRTMAAAIEGQRTALICTMSRRIHRESDLP